jgi:DNA-binding XRE family transcriptional regulator
MRKSKSTKLINPPYTRQVVMNKNEFKRHRKRLRKTQKQMAELLGTSLKAFHSYEQGWRNVPVHVEYLNPYCNLAYQQRQPLRHDTPISVFGQKKCPEFVHG